MSVNVDISTSVKGQTAVKRGDYNAAESEIGVFAKAKGTGTAIRRGYCCESVNTSTPNVFAVTTGKSSRPCVISALPTQWRPAGINVTGDIYGNGEDISAFDEDAAFQGLTESEDVALKADGVIQPGAAIMTSSQGRVKAYDGSGNEFVKGFCNGPIGSVRDANYIKQACADGDLVSIKWEGI